MIRLHHLWLFSAFELLGELRGWTPKCFFNPLTHYLRGSQLYYIHTNYITILVGLRPSKSSTPS